MIKHKILNMIVLQQNVIYKTGSELDFALRPKFNEPFISCQRWNKSIEQSGTIG